MGPSKLINSNDTKQNKLNKQGLFDKYILEVYQLNPNDKNIGYYKDEIYESLSKDPESKKAIFNNFNNYLKSHVDEWDNVDSPVYLQKKTITTVGSPVIKNENLINNRNMLATNPLKPLRNPTFSLGGIIKEIDDDSSVEGTSRMKLSTKNLTYLEKLACGGKMKKRKKKIKNAEEGCKTCKK